MFERPKSGAEKLFDAKGEAQELIVAADVSIEKTRQEIEGIELAIAQTNAQIERLEESVTNEPDIGERAALESQLLEKKSEAGMLHGSLVKAEQAMRQIEEHRDFGEESMETASQEFKKRLN